MGSTRVRGWASAAATLTFVAGALMSGTLTAAAAPTPGPDTFPPAMLRAMERDLGMGKERATQRLDFQERAAERAARAAKTLGSFAGSWVDPADDVLYVAVADDADVAAAKKLGATAVQVDHTADQLEAYQGRLGQQLTGAAGIADLYVDPATNAVVVSATADGVDAARAAVTAAGIPAGTVQVQTVEESPRALIDVVGGNAYYIDNTYRCSVGFAVTGGFVTAGHCGSAGSTTTTPSGTFAGSSFPGNDYAYVRTASGNTLVGAVNNYAGGTVAVSGSTQAAVGAAVCRSGSTTGWHCGTIQAFNATVTYSEGSVSGLIRTNVCAEQGDSGGSLVAGNQAQGMTSGGSGNCSSGGTTYFQPVNEALNAYGVSLVTSSGGGTTTPPATTCSGRETTRTGSLTAGSSAATAAFAAASGSFRGCLDGPSGADFDLYLQKQAANGRWSTVAQGITTSADEQVTYSGTAGTYRWLVQSYSGSGAFTLGYDTP